MSAQTWDEDGDGHRRWLEAQQQASEEAGIARPDLAAVHEDYIATGGDPASAERKRRAAAAQQVRDIDHHRDMAIILAARVADMERQRDSARNWVVELENKLTATMDTLDHYLSARQQRFDRVLLGSMVGGSVSIGLFLLCYLAGFRNPLW